jgi:hypothetical protein
MEAHTGALEDHTGFLGSYPRVVETHLGATETLELQRLPLEVPLDQLRLQGEPPEL